ncbi:MAG TPA: bifunctional oligoribonuclease/PAP phosphatase NrnA [Actinomycetes bacterium]|nr:bifunctional oligoribonuclease/PAP phosphatase NrnA [Actinomycetes bacterium]
MSSISPAEWQAAADALRTARSVVVSCHVNPDGDALGSALALRLALERAGRPAVASFSEPFVVAPQYRFLPGQDLLVPPAQVPGDADLFVCFDTGSLDRLGTLADRFAGARRTLVVDHHVSNTRFGDLNLIDPDAPASVVLCRELLRRLGLPLDQAVASCLYTGLLTDTGRFAYQATTPATHLLAAELLEAGVDQYEIARALFETNDIGYLRLLGDCLARIRQLPDASLVWTSVTRADLERHGVGLDATEGLIDVVRTDAASEVAAVLKELGDGAWRVSLRSKGRVDVGRVAGALGGGGHAFAAGFTSQLGLEETVKAVVDALSG